MFDSNFLKTTLALLLIIGVFAFIPTAHAQIPGGALNVAVVLQCTCGPGYLVVMTGVPGTSSGLYYIGPQTQFWVGSGYPTAWNLMYYTPSAGQCSMNAGPSCFTITANLVNWYGGSS